MTVLGGLTTCFFYFHSKSFYPLFFDKPSRTYKAFPDYLTNSVIVEEADRKRGLMEI